MSAPIIQLKNVTLHYGGDDIVSNVNLNIKQGETKIILGPSGVGKSVILQALRERHPDFVFPRSATTRVRREGEGSDLYTFVTDEEFDQFIEDGAVLEWAVVHGGARYGTLAEEIIPNIKEGKTVIREVDVQGFDSISHHRYFRGEDAPYILKSIFILPESKEQLIEHIRERAPISDDELGRRIASMEKELTYAQACDYQIVNSEGHLEETVQEVEKVLE